MNTYPILQVSSGSVKNPKKRQCISREDVDKGLLSIRILKTQRSRKLPVFHILRDEKILFTGWIKDIRTIVGEYCVDYTLISGKLSGYHVFTTANVAVQTKVTAH